MRRCLLLLVLLCMVNVAKADEQQWGDLQGRFTLEGDIPRLPPLIPKGVAGAKIDVPDESLIVEENSRGIANLIVYLKRAPAKIHPGFTETTPPEVCLTTQDLRFEPHISLVRVGQKLRVTHSDNTGYNVHVYPFSNPTSCFVLNAADTVYDFKLVESRPIKFGCNIHSYMRAWCVILDHPYVAVTDVEGKFLIRNLPVGQHEFTVWHERAGYIHKKLTAGIQPGANMLELESVDIAKFSLATKS